jgi:hypothetical protein
VPGPAYKRAQMSHIKHTSSIVVCWLRSKFEPQFRSAPTTDDLTREVAATLVPRRASYAAQAVFFVSSRGPGQVGLRRCSERKAASSMRGGKRLRALGRISAATRQSL